MKYRPSPLNICCVLAIGLATYSAVKPNPEGWGFLISIYLIPVIIIALTADFVFQKFLPKYLLTLIIELALLTGIYFAYCWTHRTKTLIIPDRLEAPYIVTIYGVENSIKLPDTWDYEVRVPANGILMTSSTYDSDLPVTKMQTHSGIRLNTDETELGWVRITHDKLVCNGKIYEYQLWKVYSPCCGYSSSETDGFKALLLRKFCAR